MKTIQEELGGKLVYLGAPYTHDDPEVIELRIELFCRVDAELAHMGIATCSPLAKHFILKFKNLPGTWEYWSSLGELYMQASKAFLIIEMEGWDKSKGVIDEVKLATKFGVPVYGIKPDLTGFRRIS